MMTGHLFPSLTPVKESPSHGMVLGLETVVSVQGLVEAVTMLDVCPGLAGWPTLASLCHFLAFRCVAGAMTWTLPLLPLVLGQGMISRWVARSPVWSLALTWMSLSGGTPWGTVAVTAPATAS